MMTLKKKKAKSPIHDAAKIREKENIISELIEKLSAKGLAVRREQLKQGHGWKTLSGVCRVEGKPTVFLDRKLPLEEQVVFLSSIVSNTDTISAYTAEEHL